MPWPPQPERPPASSTEGLRPANSTEQVSGCSSPTVKGLPCSSQLSARHEPDSAGQVQTAARGQQILRRHPRHGAGLHHPALRREGEISDQGKQLSVTTVNQVVLHSGDGKGTPGCPGGPFPQALAPSLLFTAFAGRGSRALRPSVRPLALLSRALWTGTPSLSWRWAPLPTQPFPS